MTDPDAARCPPPGLAEDLLQDAPCGFLATDADGKILYANRTLESWLGRAPGGLAAAGSVQALFDPPSRAYFETQVAPMLHVQGFAREISCRLAVPGAAATLPVLMSAKLRTASGTAADRIDFAFFDATERLRFEQTLRAARSKSDELAAIVRSAAVGILRLDADGRPKRWNAAAEQVFEQIDTPIASRPVTELLPFDDLGDWFAAAKARIEQTGQQHRFEAPVGGALVLNVSVTRIETPEDPFAQPDYSLILRDVTDRVTADRRLKLVLDELNHRVKNTMAVVLGLVNLSLRAPGLEQVRKSLVDRLHSMAASHELLTASFWEDVPFRELFGPVLSKAGGEGRIDFDGPAVMLTPNQFRTLSMAFHELTTNALKYGALSAEDGRVTVRWSLTGEAPDILAVSWTETGGPPVAPPSARGFGTAMIEKLLAGEFTCAPKMEFHPEGLQFSCSFALDGGTRR